MKKKQSLFYTTLFSSDFSEGVTDDLQNIAYLKGLPLNWFLDKHSQFASALIFLQNPCFFNTSFKHLINIPVLPLL